MLQPTLADLKSAITLKMKGTSLNQITDFYGLIAGAGNRMMARIDLQECIRTATLSSPFYDDVEDYTLPTDYGGMIDIRPQANRQQLPGLSHFTETTPRQFLERLDSNSFSIRWNSAVRTLRAQILPQGNVQLLDAFDSATSNGSWTAEGDISGLIAETLNYIEGNGSLSMDLSGSTGAGDIVNTTASVTDLSAYTYEDASFLWFWIPAGFSSRFTSFSLRRGESSSAYVSQTVTTKFDGTAFTDGWNQLRFDWVSATTTGVPTNLTNIYRRFGIAYTAGTAIPNCLIDNWTNAFGQLYEMEYFSECLFRGADGSWKYVPTLDTDYINVGPAAYEILKTEAMVDVTQIVRTGKVMQEYISDFRLQLNGQPQSRYVKDPPYHGLYADYLSRFPSTRIPTITRTYDFDV